MTYDHFQLAPLHYIGVTKQHKYSINPANEIMIVAIVSAFEVDLIFSPKLFYNVVMPQLRLNLKSQ